MKKKVKAGNQCIYCIYLMLNFFLILIGLAILICAVYLFIITKNANAFNLSFLIIGLLLMLLGGCSFKLKKSPCGLWWYNFLLAVIFLLQLIISIILIVKKDSVLKWASAHVDSKTMDEARKIYEGHLQAVMYALLGFAVFMVRGPVT